MVYVGARYTPDFLGEHSETTEYENFVVVDDGFGTSYVSRKKVPAGTPLTNREYWALYGSASGAIGTLTERVDNIEEEIKNSKNLITPEMFGAAGDGVTDDTSSFQDCIDYAIANKKCVYAGGSYSITSPLTIATVLRNGFMMFFNEITNTSTGSALILKGTDIILKGNKIKAASDTISCGDGSKGLQDSVIDIGWIESDEDAITLKPSTDENVQYISIYSRIIYYGRYGIYADLTSRHVGEINIYGCSFAAKSAIAGSSYGIYVDHLNAHSMTGLNMFGCTFESAKGGVYLNGVNASTVCSPINMFYVRSSELNQRGYKLIEASGTAGSINGTIICDAIDHDGINIPNSIRPCSISIDGIINRGTVKYSHGMYLLGEIAPILNATMGRHVTAAATFNKNNLPDEKFIRASADITFELGTDGFIDTLIIYADSSITVNMNQTAISMASGDILTIEGHFITGEGFRYTSYKTSGHMHSIV